MEVNEGNCEASPSPLNIEALDNQERISYILDVRRRIQAEEVVSDDEIRDAVRIIRFNRSNISRSPKSAKVKKPLVTLADF